MLSSLFVGCVPVGTTRGLTQHLRHEGHKLVRGLKSGNFPKSECMRFVQSCYSLVLFFDSNALDSGGDLTLLIEVGQLVQPRSVFVQVAHNIMDHIT